MYYYEDRKASVYMPDGWADMTWQQRVDAFLETKDTKERFDWPFPMAVFGTLRQYQGNNRLMHQTEVKKWQPAFLPHFYAHGLSISFKKDACAPFEIFHYEPTEWVKMLPRVDRLESFNPSTDHGQTNGGYYYRTLAWLRAYPADDQWFPKDKAVSLGNYRDMKLDPATWIDYEAIPCWIYSSIRENDATKKVKDSPVVWPFSE